MLTAKRLREVITYSPRTGRFLWKEAGPGRNKDLTAGSYEPNGYLRLTIDYVHYRAHRVAFLYVLGRWPVGLVDHRNEVKSDNRWTNLRETTYKGNAQNQSKARRNTTSKYRGVCWDKSKGMWLSQIYYGGGTHYLGHFDVEEEARDAYLVAKRKYHLFD